VQLVLQAIEPGIKAIVHGIQLSIKVIVHGVQLTLDSRDGLKGHCHLDDGHGLLDGRETNQTKFIQGI
jgi:hypothetical protein